MFDRLRKYFIFLDIYEGDIIYSNRVCCGIFLMVNNIIFQMKLWNMLVSEVSNYLIDMLGLIGQLVYYGWVICGVSQERKFMIYLGIILDFYLFLSLIREFGELFELNF